MRFETFIAARHLKNRHKSGFISLITFISIAGVGVGVMALIVVLAVMSGFDRELKNKIVNVQPHLRIEKLGGIDTAESDIAKIRAAGGTHLKTVAPFVEGQGIIRSNDSATGVIVKGMDTAREDMGIFERHILYGNLDLSSEARDTTKRRLLFFHRKIHEEIGGILLGEELAAILRVHVGDRVNLISPFQENPESLLPQRAQSTPFVVKGIFRVGMNDFDTALVLVDIHQAQKLYHLDNRVTGISLRFHDVDEAQRWKYLLRGEFNADYFLRSWYDMNHNFFQALKVEKSVMTILLALIILVAAFNIVSTLIMIVMEKTKDIGILRALGATRASIRRIFVLEGFGVGIMGVAAGTLAGLALAFNLNAVSDFLKQTTGLEVFPSDIYYFDKIPTEVHAPDVALIVVFAMIAAVLAGIYPAHRAASLNPVEALHYE
ncbi:MAG TPA: FtsX-like permease family protein [Verrucomicrobiae bacterium]|nr:FtsX-like permease family protein [Verrucomicrobiae bacterium]